MNPSVEPCPQRSALGVLSELDLALTFSELALTASDRRVARRNMVISRQAVDSAAHFLSENVVDVRTKAEIDRRIDRLKLLFRQYSEGRTECTDERNDMRRVCECALPESGLEKAALPALPKNGSSRAIPQRPIERRTTAEAVVRDSPRAKAESGPNIHVVLIRPASRSRGARAVGWLRFLQGVNDKLCGWLMSRTYAGRSGPNASAVWNDGDTEMSHVIYKKAGGRRNRRGHVPVNPTG
jgi:hypothetical protein